MCALAPSLGVLALTPSTFLAYNWGTSVEELRRDYVVKGGSLAANLRVLCGSRGRGAPFALQRAIPIDMFPHTPHVELVLLLERGVPLPQVSRVASTTPTPSIRAAFFVMTCLMTLN